MGNYDPAVRELIREMRANRTSGPADHAPPPPKAALELLKANGFPFRHISAPPAAVRSSPGTPTRGEGE